MKYHPEIHHRRSIRLRGYDYTQSGAYFITICTFQRDLIFGEINNGKTKLSPLGEIVREEWFRSSEIRKEIQVFEDEFVIMPNHLHGINWIVEADGIPPDNVGADGIRPNQGIRPNEGIRSNLPHDTMHTNVRKSDARRASLRRAPRSLGSFIAGFKASVTSRAGGELNMTGVWQRNYFEHVIRNDRELDLIRQYIVNNPLQWQLDRDNLENIRNLPPPEGVKEYLQDIQETIRIKS